MLWMARSRCSGGHYVVGLGVNRLAGDFAAADHRDFAGNGIDLADGFDLGAPKFDAQGEVIVRRINFDDVAADAEGAAAKFLGALVLNFHQLAQDGFAGDGLALFEQQHHAVIGFGRADAVDAGDGGDHDDVAAFEERARGGHAQLVEFVVDGGFFFDVGVAGRDVGFGLVVIVIADEIFDGVIGKERFEFVEELGGESFVVSQDDGRAVQFFDDLGHRERFARAGDAEQNLVAVSAADALQELRDGLGLIAAGFVVAG